MAKLRISGGELGGRRIEAPPRRGQSDVRPTTEKVREAIFSILGDVSGARVLDLFCGTGALGLEALSRGAAEATFVDAKPALAERNAEALGVSDRATVVRSDAFKFLDRAPEGSFDLVLCDPPYGLSQRTSSRLDPLVRRRARAGRPRDRGVLARQPDRDRPRARARARLRRHDDPRLRGGAEA